MTLREFKIKRLKNVIASKYYFEARADAMNGNVQHWRELRNKSNTRKAREFCESMIEMYLKRYMYYCNQKDAEYEKERMEAAERYEKYKVKYYIGHPDEFLN